MKRNKLLEVAVFMLLLLTLSVWGYGQAKIVQGTVSDENNTPLVGVNVIIQGTTTGTSTDLNGKFQIEATPETTLSFSFIGYNTENVVVGNQTLINITLTPEATQLADVVVIGYGTQPRQNLTGSVSKLDEEAIRSKPVSSLESALQGQVSGVTVVNTGSPGTSPTVRIRGIGSVNYNSDPLYVIDGMPVGNLNNFDIKDIESITILKDAASAAIYGSRAANGVVLITTKSGKNTGKMTLNVDASYGIQNAWKMLDLLNTEEHVQYGTELLTNAGLDLPYRFSHMDEPIYEGATQTYAQTNTDWQDEMFRTAPLAQFNINLSGGNEKYRYYTSYGRFSQEGIMLGTDYNRHSFRVNTESKLNKFISIGENLKASYSEMSRQRVVGGRTLVKHMVNQAPFVPVYNPTNLAGFGGAQTTDGSDAENPVRIAELETDQNNVVNLLGNVYAELKLTSWLKYRASLGMEYTADRQIIRLPIFNEGYNVRVDHELTDNRYSYYSPVFSNQLTLDKILGKHAINAVAVAEQQQTNRFVLNGSGKQSTNEIDQLGGSTAQTINGYEEKTVLLSYAGRLNYAFDNKYLLNISIRRDGSSVFAPGKKWGTFPGASLGWVVSRESFMKDVELISNLKLRASYGTLGFNAVGAYPWQSSVYTNTTAVFNNNYENNVGAYFDKLPNKDLKWEITAMSNFGIDLALFENSILFSAEYFIRQTDNLIVDNPLPTSLGYAVNPATNIGSMKNWGYEFTAGYNKNIGDINISVNGNITFLNNEVLKLSTGQPNIDRGGVTSDYGGYTLTRTEAGYPIQGFYGWVVEGIFQTQGEIDALNPDPANGEYYQTESTSPGDIKFKDINGRDINGELTGQPDGIIDEDDRTYLGSYLPDFIYGLNLSIGYKGFNASMFLQGVYGNEIYNGTKVLTQGMMRLFNAEKAVLDAWTPENPDTDIPRAVSGDPNHNARTSDRFVEDGSYLRVKNLTLSYSLPQKTLSVFRGAVSGLSVYVTAQNLLTFTKYSGYDPEIGASSIYSGTGATLLQGVDFGFYPQPRTFLLGVNMSF
ncbi:MAG: TonB-dependent receptor [Bacteroidales bacterium]|nr:TonB-dependent receptor [Bacteroidales bacterium]